MDRGSDQGGGGRKGDRTAELVVDGTVGGGELGLLGPCTSRVGEYIGRPLVSVRADLVVRGADQGGGAREGDRTTEQVVGGAVGGGELGLLGPGAARIGENIGRPLVSVRADLVVVGTDQGRGARDGDRITELVVGPAVGSGELGLLGPVTCRVGENVNRPLAGVRADLVVRGTDQGGTARDGDRITELVVGPAVGSGELGLWDQVGST